MARSTNLSRYDKSFFDNIEIAYKQGLRLVCKDSNSAKSLRLDYYAFRSGLEKEQHPHLWYAKDLTFIVEDSSLIMRRGASTKILAIEPLNESPPVEISTEQSIESIQAPKQPERFVDPMESALEKLGFFSGTKDKK